VRSLAGPTISSHCDIDCQGMCVRAVAVPARSLVKINATPAVGGAAVMVVAAAARSVGTPQRRIGHLIDCDGPAPVHQGVVTAGGRLARPRAAGGRARHELVLIPVQTIQRCGSYDLQ